MKTVLVLLASYFILVPLFLFSLIYYQSYLSQTHAQAIVVKKVLAAKPIVKVAKKPIAKPEPKIALIQAPPEDPRVIILKEFFGRYNSPLIDYAQAIVDTSDNYDLDWRLLPAIAMQESTLCKKTPVNSFNCWGFGIYGGKVTRFSDYGEAINVITKAMARDYHALGLKDPSEIVKKYTPANTNNWSGNVSFIMENIAATSSL